MIRKTIFALLPFIPACASSDVAIPAGERQATAQKPLPVYFASYDSFVVENRYLVLPLGLSPKNVFEKSSSYSRGDHLDLEVIDLQTGEHHRVFNKSVALERWDLSFRAPEQLRFPGILIIEARTTDANHDGKLTWEDPIKLYGYDLGKHDLFPILPENYSLAKCMPVEDKLILTLGAADGQVSIYAYAPQTRAGHFVVEHLKP